MADEDDGVYVETVQDSNNVVYEGVTKPEVSFMKTIVMDYWFLVLPAVLAFALFYENHLAPFLYRMLHEMLDKQREEQQFYREEPRFHRIGSRFRRAQASRTVITEERMEILDPALVQERQEAMELSRRRMQDQYDAMAAKSAEERKVREDKKREERLKKLGHVSGYKLSDTCGNNSDTNGTSNSTSSGYNPLSGGGTGGGYRPPRRGCQSGGCG